MRLTALSAAAAACLFAHAARAAVLPATPANATAAFKAAACGDEIAAAGGVYSRWRPGAVARDCSANPVVIRPADPADPPVFKSGMTIDGWSGVTFTGVTLDISDATANFAQAVRIYNGKALTFDHVLVVGRVNADGTRWGQGINAGGVDGLTIRGSTFRDLYRGAVVGASSHVSVTDNDIVDFGTDGLDFSGLKDALVARNLVQGPHPSGADHPDDIQFETVGAALPMANVTIVDNLVMGAATGAGAQNIFWRSENLTTSSNIVMSRNVGVNGGYNGFTLGYVAGGAIDGNVLLNARAADPTYASLRVSNLAGVAITNNRAPAWIGVTPGTDGNVQTAKATAADVDAAVTAWKARFRAPPSPPPPPDPRDLRIADLTAQLAAQAAALASQQGDAAAAAAQAAGDRRAAQDALAVAAAARDAALARSEALAQKLAGLASGLQALAASAATAP